MDINLIFQWPKYQNMLKSFPTYFFCCLSFLFWYQLIAFNVVISDKKSCMLDFVFSNQFAAWNPFWSRKCAYFEEIFQAKSEKAWKGITSLERERFD
jgi:hypothetical protein